MHAKRAEDEACERERALLLAERANLLPVHRHVHHESGLRRLHAAKRLAREHHLGGDRGVRGVARALHRGAPRWLREHVEADDADVACREGLVEDDGEVLGALAGRSHLIVGESIGAHPLYVRAHLGRLYPLGETDRLDAGEALVELQVRDEIAPLVARDGSRGGDARRARAQDLLVRKHAHAHGRFSGLGAALELALGLVVAGALQADPAGGGERERGHERHPGNRRTKRFSRTFDTPLHGAPAR